MPKIPTELVLQYARLGLAVSDIAALLGVREATIRRFHRQTVELGRAQLRVSIARWQLETARNKNASILVWLGRVALEQADHPIPESGAEPWFDPSMGSSDRSR
jgi:hypothetical protein